MTRILCTRKIPEDLILTAAKELIEIFICEFIQVRPNIQEKEIPVILGLLQNKNATVVFTSKHAVYSIRDFIKEKAPFISPKWKIYCIGSATMQAVKQCLPDSTIKNTASYANELADKISEDKNIKEAWFLCSNLRRETLPEKLIENGIALNELVIYETVLTPRSVQGNYDGIIFFSPSAVESFFSKNKIDPGVICFAIGKTTEAAIKKSSENKIIKSNHQSAEVMIKTCIEYYKNIPH